ncbi:MAG TPA: hypothetical protein VEA16_21440 [Vicinamibacterales bacterium]|nr:hypothetical protein [Vicinamibacterales bacterium]
MPVNASQLKLAAVALVVVAVAAYALWPASPEPAPPAAGRPARPAPAARFPEAPAVKLDALAVDREQPGEGQRNPFRFQPKVTPAPPRPVVALPPSSVEPPRPAAPPGPPPLPPIPLKLIGILERANGVKWAVLTDGKTPSPFYGKDGDIIDGRYAIVKIGTESIEMTYADGRGRQVIRLTGQ